ncbi:MAG TPA: plastocyanin/azurin family copper-binding protein [Chloroflexota bacterium]|jgi:plastocyanin|nr:plastocyanin/azurin family copper-binding protein [Chloroflexota bacterium]
MTGLPRCRPFGLALGALVLVVVPTTTAREETVVHIASNAFTPDTLTVPVGTTIRFINDDPEIHTATQNSGFDSGLIFPGQTWSYTFAVPGVYPYVCLPHPFMVGTITVE